RAAAVHEWLARYIEDKKHGWRLPYDLRGDWSGGMVDEQDFLRHLLGMTDDEWFDAMESDMPSMMADERQAIIDYTLNECKNAIARVEALEAYVNGDETRAPRL